MPVSLRLNPIPQPIHTTHSVISPDPDLPTVLIGNSMSAPELICGHCEKALVQGVPISQFLVAGPATAQVRGLLFPRGTYRITKPIEIGQSIIVSEGGPLILKCPSCMGYSEVPTGGHTQ